MTRSQKRKRAASLAVYEDQITPFSSNSGGYEYESLTTSSSIRILELQRGERSDPIDCTLSVVERDKAPLYEAISYAWGDMSYTMPIFCDLGETYYPTPGLYVGGSISTRVLPVFAWGLSGVSHNRVNCRTF